MSEKERVLVVDDEPSIRKYLQTLLEVDGYHVTAVASGPEALESVQQGEPSAFHHSRCADAGDERPRDFAPADAGGSNPERDHAVLFE